MNVRPIPYATEARSGLDHETGDTMLVLTGDGQEVLAAALSQARAEGAREERERLAKLSEETETEFAAWVVRDCKPDTSGDRPALVNMTLAEWLRSQSTGEG